MSRLVAELLTGPFEAAHLPHELVHPVSIAIALTLISVLHMLFGEMVPKNLALAGPERAALALAPPLMGFVRVFRPVIVTLTAAATGVLKLLKTEPVSEIGDAANRDAVAALISESRDGGLLPEGQHDLLSGALEFEDRTARLGRAAALVPGHGATRRDPGPVEELVTSTGFSRFPVRAVAEGFDRRGRRTASATCTSPTSWTPTRNVETNPSTVAGSDRSRRSRRRPRSRPRWPPCAAAEPISPAS